MARDWVKEKLKVRERELESLMEGVKAAAVPAAGQRLEESLGRAPFQHSEAMGLDFLREA